MPVFMMDFNRQRLPLSSIDDQTRNYRITTEENCSDLTASIEHLGLIHCPILIPADEGYEVISGFRRIRACRKLGWNCLDARVLPADTPAVECAFLAIADNSLQRPLNWLEIARSLELLEKSGLIPEDLSRTAAALRLPCHPEIIKKIRRITGLSEYVQKCVLHETISVAMAQELADRSEDEADYFARLFEDLKLSLNKQREFLSLTDEISRREEINAMDVLNAQCFQEILQNDRLDRAQKAQQLRFCLKRRRFPNMTRTYESFNEHLQRLELTTGIELSPPRNFEGRDYTFNLVFHDLFQLKKQIDFLNHLLSHPALHSLISG